MPPTVALRSVTSRALPRSSGGGSDHRRPGGEWCLLRCSIWACRSTTSKRSGCGVSTSSQSGCKHRSSPFLPLVFLAGRLLLVGLRKLVNKGSPPSASSSKRSSISCSAVRLRTP